MVEFSWAYLGAGLFVALALLIWMAVTLLNAAAAIVRRLFGGGAVQEVGTNFLAEWIGSLFW